MAPTEEDSTLSSAAKVSKGSTTWRESSEEGSITPSATKNMTQEKKQKVSKGLTSYACTYVCQNRLEVILSE